MTFDFGIAGPEDDKAIRRLLAENPMPGKVTVAFEREPAYFPGEGIMGERCVTVKAISKDSGELAGIMCMASADRFINGRITPVGYIGQIRIDHKYQGRMLPLHAMPFIREQAANGWPKLWFGAIVDDNPTARSLFIDLPRTSFPKPVEVSPIHTLAILTRRPRSTSIQPGDSVGWPAIAVFLNTEGPRRNFFPVMTPEDFTGDRRTPGLNLEDVLVASTGSRIDGICCVWDQSSVKQTVVHGYKGWLAGTRPLLNAAFPLLGIKRLPGIGQQIPSSYLSFLAVRDDNPVVLRELIRAASSIAYAQGKDFLMAGFSTRDPLLAAARKFRHILYRSTLYAFNLQTPLSERALDRSRVPYLEIAAL